MSEAESPQVGGNPVQDVLRSKDGPWSCIDLKVLMHCHYSPLPWNNEEAGSLAAVRSHAKLERLGLIRCDVNDAAMRVPCDQAGFVYNLTEKGAKLFDMIVNTPLPIKHTEWKDPREVEP